MLGVTNGVGSHAQDIGDVAGCLVKHSMIESLQTNPDVLRFHIPTDAKEPPSHSRSRDR